MSRFDDKVAVITGGSSGMALATAKLLAHQGAHVYITGRRADVLDTAVAEIGHQATGIQGNAANLADLDDVYDTVRAGHGKLDVLFASAGDGGLGEPLENVTVAAVKSIPGSGVYSASNAALRSFVRVWASEFAPKQIRVNVIPTGTINTAPIAAAPKEFVDHLVSLIPLGRTGEPE